MFKCTGCKTVQEPYCKPHRVVIEKRQVAYNTNGNVSKGWEIVREVNLCDKCHVVGEP